MSLINKPKANKNLGQHYLNNKTTITKICDDFDGKYDAIIEIGPGPGTLTFQLAEKNKPLFLIEKDDRFLEILENINPKPEIINEDALSASLDALPKEVQNIWLVSNLPYNVGTQIMLRFIKVQEIKFMTLMFQKEVAQKIFLPLNGEKKALKEMNSLHCLVNNFFQISLLTKVSPGQFSPPPKVDSAVIRLERRSEPTIALEQWKSFEAFLRRLFAQKRKQMKTVLKSHYGVETLEKTLHELKISSNIRAETLLFAQVIQLYQLLEKNNV